MVYRHGSKYNTNKRVSKNLKHVIDKQIAKKECLRRVVTSNCNNYASPEDKGYKFEGDYVREYRVYTDNTEYEHIDKKERKKLFKKTHEKEFDSEDETAEEEEHTAPISARNTYKLVTKKDAFVPERPPAEMVIKKKNREYAERDLKMFRFKGNSNHAFNSLDMPAHIDIPHKKLKKLVVKNAGKKDCLYNGDFSIYKPYDNYKDKSERKANRKRANARIIKSDLKAYKESCK